MLDVIHRADVSAAAGVIALSRVLLPGYAFIVPGLDRIVLSEGTRLSSRDPSVIKGSAKDHGIHSHQEKAVQWFQLVDPSPEFVADDLNADATAILRSVVRSVYGTDEKHVTQSINGIVGAALGQIRSTNPSVIFGVLKHKFDDRASLRDLIQKKDFVRYLRIKSIKAANRNGQKR
jgi:hypothetical protein